MKMFVFVVINFVLLLIIMTANAAEYQGYVPKGLAELGETWPGVDAAGILGCKGYSSSKINASLNRGAAHTWYGMCSKANSVHAQLTSGNCFQTQAESSCHVAISADNAIRRDPEFWHIVNALRGKADDYGLNN